MPKLKSFDIAPYRIYIQLLRASPWDKNVKGIAVRWREALFLFLFFKIMFRRWFSGGAATVVANTLHISVLFFSYQRNNCVCTVQYSRNGQVCVSHSHNMWMHLFLNSSTYVVIWTAHSLSLYSFMVYSVGNGCASSNGGLLVTVVVMMMIVAAAAMTTTIKKANDATLPFSGRSLLFILWM